MAASRPLYLVSLETPRCAACANLCMSICLVYKFKYIYYAQCGAAKFGFRGVRFIHCPSKITIALFPEACSE